jgi:uncharacterized protein
MVATGRTPATRERMLSYNVAALLRSAPGTARTYHVSLPTLAIAEDVTLGAPVTGDVELHRTSRSILARGHVATAFVEPCVRCLVDTTAPVEADFEEEALPSIDIDSGLPVAAADEPDALRLDDHHELDLTETVREAISLAEPLAPLCRPDCRGLCLECGADLNADPAHHHDVDAIDPRLAALKALRDTLT